MSQSSPYNVIRNPARDGTKTDETASHALATSELNLSARPYKSVASSFDVLVPYINPVNSKWKRWVDDAALVWSRLTEDDLLELATRRRTLGTLVRARYRLSAHEADRQVTSFIEDHRYCAL